MKNHTLTSKSYVLLTVLFLAFVTNVGSSQNSAIIKGLNPNKSLTQIKKNIDPDKDSTLRTGVLHDDIIFAVRPTNPFTSQINLTYEIAKSGVVNMDLFDINGRAVISVVNNEYREKGTYQININTEGVKSGFYFLNYRSGSNVKTLKLLKVN